MPTLAGIFVDRNSLEIHAREVGGPLCTINVLNGCGVMCFGSCMYYRLFYYLEQIGELNPLSELDLYALHYVYIYQKLIELCTFSLMVGILVALVLNIKYLPCSCLQEVCFSLEIQMLIPIWC